MLTLLSRLFYYESAAGRKLDSAGSSGTNTLGKLAFVKVASQTTRRALLGDRRVVRWHERMSVVVESLSTSCSNTLAKRRLINVSPLTD